jgi:hypothetical protein
LLAAYDGAIEGRIENGLRFLTGAENTSNADHN